MEVLLPVARSKVHVGPSKRLPSRSGQPSGLQGRPDVPVAAGRARAERASRNQECRSEVWFGTRSRSTRIPRRAASAIEAVEVGERAQLGVNVRVVGDVVAQSALGDGIVGLSQIRRLRANRGARGGRSGPVGRPRRHRSSPRRSGRRPGRAGLPATTRVGPDRGTVTGYHRTAHKIAERRLSRAQNPLRSAYRSTSSTSRCTRRS